VKRFYNFFETFYLCAYRLSKMTTELHHSGDPRQSELLQLQKEYRNMEINRRAYAEESQSILRTQQTTIDKLRKDNDALKNDIALIMRGTTKAVTADQQEAVQILNEQGEKYLQAIDMEKKNIEIMEEQIGVMKQKVLQQRKAMGGVNASRENYMMIQKQIRILENRLDKSLIKFNESSAHNKSLRNQIDDLRRERIVFENIYRKMEKDLQEKKRCMAEIIEISNQSYEQRDNFQMEIAAIEQANRKENEEFEEQMSTLSKLMDNDLALPAPSSSLGQRSKSLVRLNSMTASLTSPGGGGARGRSAGGVGFSSPTHHPLQSSSLASLSAASGSITKDNNISSSNNVGGPGSPSGNGSGNFEVDFRERAQNFEEAFNKIRIATGINDIDELVTTFIKNEEHNFSLFNYVNEQNNEIEKYEEQITALREEESKYATESGNDVNQHKEILKDLENKLQATDTMAEKYDLRCQDLSRVIESLKRGMQSIISKLEWDSPPLEDSNGAATVPGASPGGKSGDNGGLTSPNSHIPVVTEVNMVNYLGILEKKSIQLLHSYHQIQQLLLTNAASNKDNKSSALDLLHGSSGASASSNQDLPFDPNAANLLSVLGSGPKIPMGQDHLHVNPPKADDYRSDDDDDEDEDEARPLTRDELKSRTLNRLQKRIQGLNLAANNIASTAGMIGGERGNNSIPLLSAGSPLGNSESLTTNNNSNSKKPAGRK
jgi:hypothetical protein